MEGEGRVRNKDPNIPRRRLPHFLGSPSFLSCILVLDLISGLSSPSVLVTCLNPHLRSLGVK